MSKIFIRRAALAALSVAVLGLLGWALWPQPVPVDIATIERNTLEINVEDEGVTRVREVYAISAPTVGKMLRTTVEVGDLVIAGETILSVFEPSDPAFLDIRTQRVNEAAVAAANASVRLAESQVKQAEAQLTFAQGELRRATELAPKQAISARELDKAQLDRATAEATLASAAATLDVRRRELESAQARLIQPGQAAGQETADGCCIQLRAPISGHVLKIVAKSEQVVQPGSTLMELGSPADIEIAVDLLSRDAVRVEPGATARIESWGGDAVLNARVRRIEPTGFTKISALGIEEQRVKAVLDFTDPREAWRRLGHGYRVVAKIAVWRGEDIAVVPLAALFRQGNQWAVFVVMDGRARLRLVEIGERTLHDARILSGLTAGEQVVLHPSDRIRADINVAPRR